MPTAKRLADERHARNAGSPTNKPQVKDADPVGIAGELIFAKWAGLSASPVNSLGPDRGWDFVTVDGRTIDVKSTNYGHGDDALKRRVGLFADEGQVKADIYVLVYVDQTEPPEGLVLGWATADEMAAAAVREVKRPGTAYSLRGHWIHRFKIRRPSTLQVNGTPEEIASRTEAAKGPPTLERFLAPDIGMLDVTMTADRKLGYVQFDDETGEKRGMIVYHANRKRKAAVGGFWYVFGDETNSASASWQQAAAHAYRLSMLRGLTFSPPREPQEAVVDPVEDHAQAGLDFTR